MNFHTISIRFCQSHSQSASGTPEGNRQVEIGVTSVIFSNCKRSTETICDERQYRSSQRKYTLLQAK